MVRMKIYNEKSTNQLHVIDTVVIMKIYYDYHQVDF